MEANIFEQPTNDVPQFMAVYNDSEILIKEKQNFSKRQFKFLKYVNNKCDRRLIQIEVVRKSKARFQITSRGII